MQAFVYNTRRTIFKDPVVREALAYAFDFEWANKNLAFGSYKRTRSYFDNSELAATGVPSARNCKFSSPIAARSRSAFSSRNTIRQE